MCTNNEISFTIKGIAGSNFPKAQVNISLSSANVGEKRSSSVSYGHKSLRTLMKRSSLWELPGVKFPRKRKNYSQDLKDAIEEFHRRKDKPHVIEEFFCGSDRQSLTVGS